MFDISTSNQQQQPRYRASKYEKLNDEEWLREMYEEKGLGSTTIADHVGCSSTTVRKWLRNHGIEIRENGGGVKKLHDKGWLRTKLFVEERDIKEIADMLGCSPSTVTKWKKEHNIDEESMTILY